MADRVITYDGALPQTTDILNTNIFAMISEAYQNRAVLGTSTVVAGLACAPTAPASLQVSIGVGSIFQLDPTDQTAYGDLGTNNNNIMKQGILQAPVLLTITPPSTAGFSQVYLVEAIIQDVDTGSTVLSYYNSSNPVTPFSGPANSGTSNFTIRTCQCAIALKAGVAATTGTQVTPTPDAGYVGLFAITVANGQATITSPNIVQSATAPFFPTLPSVPVNVLDNSWTYANDTGAVNAMVVTLSPIPTAYVTGMQLRVKAANTITSTTVTINVNGLGNVAVKHANGAALIFTPSPDITSGQIVDLIYDGVNFQIANFLGVTSGAVTNNFNSVGAPYVLDTGSLNVIIANYSPAITSGQQVAGLLISVKLANTITGACTINVNSLGVKNLLTGDLQNPPYNVYVAGEILLLFYDGTQYQIVNSSSIIYRKPSANTTIYVNTSTGSDTLYDGTAPSVGSGTSGPLKTISKAMLVAFGYAPSQFTITIQVAAGTYNEAVVTPLYAGPNVIINGAGIASTTVSSGSAHAFLVQGPNTLTVQNLTAQTSLVYPYVCFGSLSNATMITSSTASGNCGAAVFYANQGGNLQVNGNHTFNGNSVDGLWWAISNGTINISTVTITFSTSISVPLGTVVASACGEVSINNANPPTFVNPTFVNGPKFVASLNGVINANGLGISFLPGNSAGTTNTGGQVSF